MIQMHNIILPNKPLTNVDLESAVKKLKILNFRETFSRDALLGKPQKKSGILNLDNTLGVV